MSKVVEKPRHISEDEMRDWLRKIFNNNPEESLLSEFTRNLLDPARPFEKAPENQKRRPRFHPLLVVLAAVAIFIISVFIYFSFLR
jgi:hypothetical protein